MIANLRFLGSIELTYITWTHGIWGKWVPLDLAGVLHIILASEQDCHLWLRRNVA